MYTDFIVLLQTCQSFHNSYVTHSQRPVLNTMIVVHAVCCFLNEQIIYYINNPYRHMPSAYVALYHNL